MSITYDGTTLTASSGGAMVSYGIDIPAVIGTDSAYVGLSAATSGGYGNHDIVSWRFRSPSQVPEPSTLALMAIGLVGAGVAGRRKLAA